MLDITTSCRTCMKDNVTLVDLYGTVEIEENYFQLAELLVQCTSTEVSKEDGLPQHLCDACVKVLQVAYTFRKQAAKAQDEFKKLLQSSIKSEPDEVKSETDDYFSNYEDFNFNPDVSKTELSEEYSCTKCNKHFTKQKKYLKHLELHELSLACTVCDKLYSNQSFLDKHVAKHHKSAFLVSDETLLEQIVEQSGDVQVKTETEEPAQLLQCPDCQLTFTKQRSLSQHMKKHKNKNELKEFICDACGKAFAMKHLLKRHLALHSDVKMHKCEKCSKTYSRRDQLMAHMYTHKEQKRYVCSYCNKGFIQMCSLKDHLRTHTGETPYLCSQCGKGFANSSNLRQHMMRHSGVKPYACHLCPKTFCTKGQMTSHVATHTGEHPYKCEECGAAFTKGNSLKKHSLIHLPVRPFPCDTCNMRFTCKDHLKRHQRIHTGEKPYKCKYCDRAFSQSNDLVKHTRQHIGQNTYQCTICSTRFRLQSELKQHYPIHFTNGKDPNDPHDSQVTPPTKETAEPTENNPIEDPPLLKIRPPEFNPISYKDKDMLKVNDKGIPLLSLKPDSDVGPVHIDHSRIVITINHCDTNGVVNGITIKLPDEES
ncbi:zinc finger protein 883-like [Helicoverpa zea]|uniref:zinc finger protein 883-like n=1 Tax=Helicoverpa zea TaxID=7113 RepID=UPI001F562B4E|nr:zinc finger protein 883-like [Helicoverpa zea]